MPKKSRSSKQPAWFNHPKYQSYWKSYNAGWQWYNHHKQAFESAAGGLGHHGNFFCGQSHCCQSHESRSFWQSQFPWMQSQHGGASFQTSVPCHHQQSGNLTNRVYPENMWTDSVNDENLNDERDYDADVSEHIYAEQHVDDDDDDLEMEISEEMMAFFEKTEKHRKELKAKRDTENNEDRELLTKKYTTVENAFTGRLQQSCLPPRERPGKQRTLEMAELYGKEAAMIHGMETAMQLTFDRNCDKLQPKLWPNIPLNL